MSSPTPLGGPGYTPPDWHDEPRHWVVAGLTAMFVLIGIAVVAAVVVPMFTYGPSWMPMNHPEVWNWVPGLIGLVIGLFILLWLLRFLLWAVSRPGYEPYMWHHRHHYHRGWMGADPAVDVARERYARGEITQEQYDRILRDLGRPIPPPA